MHFSVIGPVYPYRGGIAHYTTQLVQAMSSAGHIVHTMSFKQQYPAWLYPGVSDKDPSRIVKQVEAEFLLDPINPLTWRKAVHHISAQKPDLVVIHWWATFWAPAFAWISSGLRRKHLKVVYLIHNVLPHEQRMFDPWLAKMALSPGNAFIVQTELQQQQLLRLLPGRSVEIRPHPVYTRLVELQIPKADARIKLGFPTDRPLILFFGIVRPYKGLKNLIEAMALINRDNTISLPLLLVAGEIWEDKDAYRHQIDRLNLANCVRLDDRYVPDEEAAVMFSAADMFVAPYLTGTQSGTASMALGFGLPMVVTEVVAGGISEENRGGLKIVAAGDASALAQAIQQVLTDPDRARPAPATGTEDWRRLVTTLEGLA